MLKLKVSGLTHGTQSRR